MVKRLFISAFMALLCVPVLAHHKTVKVTKIVGTCVNDASVGDIAITDPGDATADDANNTGIVGGDRIEDAEESQRLKGTMAGNVFAIPDGSRIDSFRVEIDIIDEQGAAKGLDLEVKLIKAGTVTGTDQSKGSAVPSAQTIVVYAPGNLWGTTWTPAQVNATDFGVAWRGQVAGDVGRFEVGIDFFKITVIYTEYHGGTTNYFTSRNPATTEVKDTYFDYDAQTTSNGAATTLTVGTAASVGQFHRALFEMPVFGDTIIYPNTFVPKACTLWVTPTVNFGTTTGDKMQFDLHYISLPWHETESSFDSAYSGRLWTVDGGDIVLVTNDAFECERVHADSIKWTLLGTLWGTHAIADGDSLPIVIPALTLKREFDRLARIHFGGEQHGYMLVPDNSPTETTNKDLILGSSEHGTESNRPMFSVVYEVGVDRAMAETISVSRYVEDSVSTTGTAKKTDTLIITEPGDWMMFFSFSFETQSASVEARAYLIQIKPFETDDTLRRIMMTSTTSGVDNWTPQFWMYLHRKHERSDDTFFIEIKSSGTVKTVIRKRSMEAKNMVHYGEENKVWFYKELVGSVNYSTTTFTTGVAHWFKPTVDGTWFIIQSGTVKRNGAHEVWSRLLVRNDDKPTDVTVNFLNFRSGDGNIDTSGIGSIYMAAVEADSLFQIASQYRTVSTGENINIMNDVLFGIDSAAFVNLLHDEDVAILGGNNFAPKAEVKATSVFDNSTGLVEDILVFASQGVITGTNLTANPRGFVELKQDNAIYDSAWNRDRTAVTFINDTMVQMGFVKIDNSASDSSWFAGLWGRTFGTAGKYKDNRIVALGNASAISDSTWFYRTGNTEDFIQDAHMNEAAATTTYGNSDSITLGSTSGTQEFNALFKDTLSTIGPTDISVINLVTLSDSLIRVYLNLKIKSVPTAAADSITVDLAPVFNTRIWVENELTWNNYKSATAWTTGGGDGTNITEELVRFIGITGGLGVRVEINGVFWDTVYIAEDRHIPIPLAIMAVDSFLTLQTQGYLFKTDAAKSTDSKIISFHSSEATFAWDRPYMTYEYLEGGRDFGTSPATELTSDSEIVILGDGIIGYHELDTRQNIADLTALDQANNTDDASMREVVPTLVAFGPTTTFVGYGTGGRNTGKENLLMRWRALKAAIPTNFIVDSGAISIGFKRLLGTLGSFATPKKMFLKIHELEDRPFESVPLVNSPSWNVTVDNAGVDATLNWFIAGAQDSVDPGEDIFEALVVGADVNNTVRQGGDHHGFDEGGTVTVGKQEFITAFRKDGQPFESQNSEFDRYWFSLDAAFLNRVVLAESPTYTSETAPIETITYGWILATDSVAQIAGDDTWRIQMRRADNLGWKPEQSMWLVVYLHKAPPAGGPPPRRRRIMQQLGKHSEDSTLLGRPEYDGIKTGQYVPSQGNKRDVHDHE